MYLKNLLTLVFLRISTFSFIILVAVSCKEVDPDAQIRAEIAAIDSYLGDNVTAPVLYDPSGMRMVIYVFGETPSAQPNQVVRFDYTATSFSTGVIIEGGTMIDTLKNISIPGLRYCISSMMGGSIATFYVPSKHAYGESGTASVPPNSTIVFDVSGIEVIKTSQQQAQFDADTTAIRQHINKNDIRDAVMLPSGVWYTTDTPGTGKYPTPYDNITFQYKGAIMSNGSVFQEGTSPGTVTPFGLIDGLKAGLPHMQEGGTTTFYIPSGLAYGQAGQTGTIPANANLIYTVQLTTVQSRFPGL